jgi:hypothetical protein
LKFGLDEYKLEMDWYRSAESKAQILLTVNGGLLAIVTSSILSAPDDLSAIRREASPLTWLMGTLFLLSVAGSAVFCVRCLHSRIYRSKDVEPRPDLSSPGSLGFFQRYGHLEPDHLSDRLNSMQEGDYTKIVAHQLVALGRNVTRKHRLVNWAFITTSAGYVALTLGIMAYLS